MNPLNRQCIEELTPLIGKSDTVFFVGSGLGMPVYSSWGQLLMRLLEFFKQEGVEISDEIIGKIERAVSGNKFKYFPFWFGHFQALESDLYLKFIQYEFSTPPNAVRLGLLHLLKLGCRKIITTNFDYSIESAAAFLDLKKRTGFYPSDACFYEKENEVEIIHIHGLCSSETKNPNDFVLSKESYVRAYGDSTAGPMRSLYVNLLKGQNVIFLGLGLSEPSMQFVLSELDNIGSKYKGYLVLEKDIVMKEMNNPERFGIKVLRYEKQCKNHSGLDEILCALNGITHRTPHEVRSPILVDPGSGWPSDTEIGGDQ